MGQHNRAVGRYGEQVAARYLIDAGLEIVDTNWRCEFGEVDIVARDGDCLVVCEVKTRTSEAFGSPIEAVHGAKAARLRRLAGAWVAAHPALARGAANLRIDVIGVLRPRQGRSQITHLAGIGA